MPQLGKLIEIELTHEQVEKLQPLVRKAMESVRHRHAGMIIAQVMSRLDALTMEPVPTMRVNFVPMEVAEEIQNVFIREGYMEAGTKAQWDADLEFLYDEYSRIRRNQNDQ